MSNTVKNQPMYIAEDGLVRFKENHVVRHLKKEARMKWELANNINKTGE